jgi:hypothetical protein
MAYRRQIGGQGLSQQIGDVIEAKALVLSEWVVVVADGRNAGFLDELSQAQRQGDVHRDGQRIPHHRIDAGFVQPST